MFYKRNLSLAVAGSCILLSMACNLPRITEPGSDQKAKDTPGIQVTTLPVSTSTPAFRRFEMRPTIGEETFSTATTNADPPVGMQKSLPIPVGGLEGGAFCPESQGPPFLQDSPPVVYMMETIISQPVFLACGWQPGEQVNVTMHYPDGTSRTEIKTEDGNGIYFEFQPGYGDLLGSHSITFEGASGKISHVFQVESPREAGIHKVQDGVLYLYGFPISEDVRIFGYRVEDPNVRLVAWRELTLDPNGELRVNDEIRADFFGVWSIDTGELWSDPLWGTFLQGIITPSEGIICPNTLPTRISKGSVALVAPGGIANNLRMQPNATAVVIGLASPGDRLQVLGDEPVCRDGYIWWHVRVEKNGLEGWVAEGTAYEYWLEPLSY